MPPRFPPCTPITSAAERQRAYCARYGSLESETDYGQQRPVGSQPAHQPRPDLVPKVAEGPCARLGPRHKEHEVSPRQPVQRGRLGFGLAPRGGRGGGGGDAPLAAHAGVPAAAPATAAPAPAANPAGLTRTTAAVGGGRRPVRPESACEAPRAVASAGPGGQGKDVERWAGAAPERREHGAAAGGAAVRRGPPGARMHARMRNVARGQNRRLQRKHALQRDNRLTVL